MRRSTIKDLVIDYVRRCDGIVDYAALEREVLAQFPESRWKKSHWLWYRNQFLRSEMGRALNASALEKLARDVR